MEPLTAHEIAAFFDEIQEEWLTPFDWNPNERLPRAQQKVYRIKQLFIDTYRKKICKYNKDEIDYARVRFHTIFADNRIYALQAHDETNKLKMMADADQYFVVTLGDRNTNSRTLSNDLTNETSTSKGKVGAKAGQLTGSVDAIQLGSVLDETERVIDTNKLPDFFDRNVRGYNQGVNVNDSFEDSTSTSNVTGNSDVNVTGATASKVKRGVDAMNQFRAYNLNVKRLREEFVQCFNVMF